MLLYLNILINGKPFKPQTLTSRSSMSAFAGVSGGICMLSRGIWAPSTLHLSWPFCAGHSEPQLWVQPCSALANRWVALTL